MKDALFYWFLPGLGFGIIAMSVYLLRDNWGYYRIGNWVLKRVWFVRTATRTNLDVKPFGHHKQRAIAYAQAYEGAYIIRIQWRVQLWCGNKLKRQWDLCNYPAKKWDR